MSDTELLPCPFCRADMNDPEMHANGCYIGMLIESAIKNGFQPIYGPAELKNAWNQRTPPDGYVLVQVNNIISVERTSDQSVLVGFSSCRAASVFEGLMPEVK